MMRSRNGLGRRVSPYRWIGVQCTVLVAAFLGFGGDSSVVQGATVILDQDTTIDALNSFPNDLVHVSDGAAGPTTVNMLPGGAVKGFIVSGNSAFEIKGGSSTFLGEVQDYAKLFLRSGKIDCSESECLIGDFDALLTADDSSVLHFYGGVVDGMIRLNGMSTAHFYGRDLVLTTVGSQMATVEGRYLNGDPLFAAFHFGSDIEERVVLHNVPEPSTTSILATLSVILFLFVHKYRTTSSSSFVAPNSFCR